MSLKETTKTLLRCFAITTDEVSCGCSEERNLPSGSTVIHRRIHDVTTAHLIRSWTSHTNPTEKVFDRYVFVVQSYQTSVSVFSWMSRGISISGNFDDIMTIGFFAKKDGSSAVLNWMLAMLAEMEVHFPPLELQMK